MLVDVAENKICRYRNICVCTILLVANVLEKQRMD